MGGFLLVVDFQAPALTKGIYIKVLMPPSETINHEKIVKENHET